MIYAIFRLTNGHVHTLTKSTLESKGIHYTIFASSRHLRVAFGQEQRNDTHYRIDPNNSRLCKFFTTNYCVPKQIALFCPNLPVLPQSGRIPPLPTVGTRKDKILCYIKKVCYEVGLSIFCDALFYVLASRKWTYCFFGCSIIGAISLGKSLKATFGGICSTSLLYSCSLLRVERRHSCLFR